MFLASPLCDYNAPLLAPAFAASLTPAGFRRLWASVIRRLRSEARFRFDLYDLQKMPETVAGRDHAFRALPLSANPSRAYIATLGGDWEAFYAERRSASTRKTERKHAKRLSEQGDVAFSEPASGDARVATIDNLIGQKRRALARMGADDIFDRQGYVAFYRAVAASEKMAGLVHVSRLDVGSEMGAASVALVDRGSYSLVLSSYNDGPISQHGPGRAHLHALMQRAIAQHFAAFDFTIGDEPYKRDWCDREVTLYDYHAAASLPRLADRAGAVVVPRPQADGQAEPGAVGSLHAATRPPALTHRFRRRGLVPAVIAPRFPNHDRHLRRSSHRFPGG